MVALRSITFKTEQRKKAVETEVVWDHMCSHAGVRPSLAKNAAKFLHLPAVFKRQVFFELLTISVNNFLKKVLPNSVTFHTSL